MKVNNAKRFTRTKLCNTALWNDIFDNFKWRKNTIVHEEAISALTTAARPAAREAHQLINPGALNEEHKTEDDADLYVDSLSEELSPTSDSSPPSQLSLQLRAPVVIDSKLITFDISRKFYQM